MTKVLTASPNQWSKEYKNKGIPSSFRDDPSGSVQYFLAFLQAHNAVTGRLLDIGCGTARNSQYMADQGFHVTCVDYVKELIERIELYKTTGENIIKPVLHDVSTPWPFVSREFDVAIDTFCYKHQIPLESKDTYKKELARVLKKNGYYLLTLAGTDDGYYKQFLNSSPENNRNIIIDPEIDIASILYTKEDIENEFNMDFELVDYQHKSKNSLMHGKVFNRSTHVFVFKRR